MSIIRKVMLAVVTAVGAVVLSTATAQASPHGYDDDHSSVQCGSAFHGIVFGDFDLNQNCDQDNDWWDHDEHDWWDHDDDDDWWDDDD